MPVSPNPVKPKLLDFLREKSVLILRNVDAFTHIIQTRWAELCRPPPLPPLANIVHHHPALPPGQVIKRQAQVQSPRFFPAKFFATSAPLFHIC